MGAQVAASQGLKCFAVAAPKDSRRRILSMRGRSAFTPVFLLLALSFASLNGRTFQVPSLRVGRRGVISAPEDARPPSGLAPGSYSQLDRSFTSLRALTGSKEVDLAIGGSVV